MTTQSLAEQFDLPGVSDRTLTPMAGAFRLPPGTPQRRLVELLFEATRRLPKGKRDGHIRAFIEDSKAMSAVHENSKPTDFRLLPPARLRLSQHTALPKYVCPEAYRRIEAMSGLPADRIIAEIMGAEAFAPFREFTRIADQSNREHTGGLSETNMGYLSLYLSMVHWEIGGGITYVTSDELDAELQATELPESLPASCLMSPYPALFIGFTESGASPLVLTDPATGEHRVQGVFVYQSYSPKLMPSNVPMPKGDGVPLFERDQPARLLTLVFMGEGKSNPWDDTYKSYQLIIPNEREPLVELLERHSDAYSTGMTLPNGQPMVPATQETNAQMRACIKHLAKALVYLGSEGAAFEPHTDRRDELRKLASKKNAAKVAKAQERADRLLDYTVLGRGRERREDTSRRLHRAAEFASSRINTAAEEALAAQSRFELVDEASTDAWGVITLKQPDGADGQEGRPVSIRSRRARWISSRVGKLRPDLDE